MGKLYEVILASVFIGIILLCIYVMFIVVPVQIYAEAECLAAGYPDAKVSFGLERYCTNLDGVVTVKVDKQGE